MQGDLMVVGREGFQKRYDLTEKVLSEKIDTRYPDFQEQAAYLLRTNLRAHGFVNLKTVCYLRKGKELRQAIKEQIESLIDQKKLLPIQAPGGELFYTEPKMLDQKYRASERVKLLSPFDNLVIQRERCREIFEFNYQIECYVPKAKRQYGYFCLPILFKDKLLGRVDIKADRKTSVMKILNFQLELDREDHIIECLAKAIKEFMMFNSCVEVTVEDAVTASLKKNLKAALKQI